MYLFYIICTYIYNFILSILTNMLNLFCLIKIRIKFFFFFFYISIICKLSFIAKWKWWLQINPRINRLPEISFLVAEVLALFYSQKKSLSLIKHITILFRNGTYDQYSIWLNYCCLTSVLWNIYGLGEVVFDLKNYSRWWN